MKKVMILLLCAVLMLGMFAACKSEPAPETEPPIETEPKKDFSSYKGIVADTKTWYDELMALPIANENMTEDELRQLAADAFRINLSFTWTPTTDVRYSYTLLDRPHEYYLPRGIAYSGLCYASGYEKGTIWKALKYYDPETGALDIEPMGENFLHVISSACSRGAQWGWNRVCNSSNLSWMTTYEQGRSNIVLVGPYTYPPHTYSFDHGDGTTQIVKLNGEETMYESYAAMKVADGLYASKAYHVMMCSATPVVERWPSGRIDPERSYMLVHEQGAVGSSGDTLNYQQENGVTLRPLGTVNKKYTFKQLLDKYYVPFTLKEFIGEDPIEPGKAWIGSEVTPIENGQDLSLSDILGKNLRGNYALCTVEFQVKNPDGKVLKTVSPDISTYPSDYMVQLWGLLNEEDFAPLANGSNTIHIYARLSNGELLEAFNTVLKVD